MSFSLPHNLYQEYIAGQKYAKVQFVQENFDACISASNTLDHSLSNTNAKVDTLAQSSVYLGKIELSAIPASMLPMFGWYAMNGDQYPINSPVGERLLELAELDYMQEFLANCPIVEGSGNIALPNWALNLAEYIGAGGTSPATTVMPFMRPINGSRLVGKGERDAIRNIEGSIRMAHGNEINDATGVFLLTTGLSAYQAQAHATATSTSRGASFKASRVVPTSVETRPASRGMTPVMYVGV